MYRFNGQDLRLQRELEAAMMVMEATTGLEHRWALRVVGHSGSSDSIDLFAGDGLRRFEQGGMGGAAAGGAVPGSDAERWAVLQRVVAHTQFCQAGDQTVPAIERVAKQLADARDAQGGLLIAVSDANLDRYRIKPAEVAAALASQNHAGVDAHFIAIAQFGESGDRLVAALPTGKGHVCEDPKALPVVIRRLLMQRADQRAR
jgi:hypothetical protein